MPVLARTRASSNASILPSSRSRARLVVERIDLADAALHEQEDDPLGPGGEVRRPRGQRVAGAIHPPRPARRPGRPGPGGRSRTRRPSAGLDGGSGRTRHRSPRGQRRMSHEGVGRVPTEEGVSEIGPPEGSRSHHGTATVAAGRAPAHENRAVGSGSVHDRFPTSHPRTSHGLTDGRTIRACAPLRW